MDWLETLEEIKIYTSLIDFGKKGVIIKKF